MLQFVFRLGKCCNNILYRSNFNVLMETRAKRPRSLHRQENLELINIVNKTKRIVEAAVAWRIGRAG